MNKFSFCPNPACQLHEQGDTSEWYAPRGSYHTTTFGTVMRYRCKRCGCWFSRQSFSIDYYAKRVVNYQELLLRHVASSSGRAISRAMGISPDSVQNRLDRLARQALGVHAAVLPLVEGCETVCVDGFVSFDVSQYFPSEVTISITADSRFVLDLSQTNRRRSGTMTAGQTRRARQLYAKSVLEHGGVSRTFREVLDSLRMVRPHHAYVPLVITTDEKPEYVRVLDHHPLFRTQDEFHRVIHQRINAQLPRNAANPLFASNYLDREIRKDLANHHRETACFSRNVANGLCRLAVYMVHHNYFKRFCITAPCWDKRLHGEAAGIPRAVIDEELSGFFSERRFRSRVKLLPTFERIWEKTSPTPLKSNPEYVPHYALV